jgi:hypothetical protein
MQFLAMLFSIFIPLLYGLFFILGMKMHYNKNLKFCIKETTKLQRDHRRITKALLKLNHPARILRATRTTAEIAFKAAAPPYKPAAWAFLQFVKTSQKALRTTQKGLLATAKASSAKQIGKLISRGFYPKKVSRGLEVKASPPLSDSPSYFLKPSYAQRKTVVFSKARLLKGLLPRALSKNFKNVSSQTIKVVCGARLEQKGGQPSKIKIIMDRL